MKQTSNGVKRETHTIDATNKVLGKLAVEIAVLLRGKHKVNFQLNIDSGDFVSVKNVDKIKFTGKKLEKKKYYHHTGYIGSLKETSLGKLFEKNPAEVLRRAVFGMLPSNKLRKEQINRLKCQ
ncbi:MAG: 50S ribosomal protein L13 [Candidatus Nealsonbacteria bacterium]|nr:50S ribosomal protein L13 [Candidatus Nealsonbacteria bacterium]